MVEKMKKITPDKRGIKVEESSKPYYPDLHLKLKDIPEAKSWDVGKTYVLLIGVRMSSIREDEDGSDVGFKVIKVAPTKNNKE